MNGQAALDSDGRWILPNDTNNRTQADGKPGLDKDCCCNLYQQARFCSDSSLANLWKLISELPPGVDEPILLRDADGICYFFDLDLDLPSQTHGPLFGKGTDITHPDGCTDIRCTCPGGIGAPCFNCDDFICPDCHLRTPKQLTAGVNGIFMNSCENCVSFCFGKPLPSGSMGDSDYNAGLGYQWHATYTLTQTGNPCIWETLITLPISVFVYSESDCNTPIYTGTTAIIRCEVRSPTDIHVVCYDPNYPISYYDSDAVNTGTGCGSFCDPPIAGCGGGQQCYQPCEIGIAVDGCDGNGCL